MTSNLHTRHSADVKSLVTQLLSEGDLFHRLKGTREGRSDVRREFARIAELVMEDGSTISGYTRDISTSGVGLITESPVNPLSKAIIRIQSLSPDVTAQFIADCVWCSDTGVGGICSGWKFTRVF